MMTLFSSERVWRILAAVWMAVILIIIEADLLLNGTLGGAMNAISIIYIAVLSIYAGTKEFSRWHELYDNSRHPGELAVAVWTVFMIGIFLEKIIFRPGYMVPGAVISTYIAVLTIFAWTTRSKAEYKRAKEK